MRFARIATAFALTATLTLGSASAPLSAANAQRPKSPLKFWEGRTESTGTVKLLMKKPFKSHAVGIGTIRSDGSLHLVQHVTEPDKAPFDRVWHIREVAPGRYSGTMSQASGAVTIDEVDGKFRFRFRMKGNLSVEQWLYPSKDWNSARNEVTIRKFGVVVGRSEGIVRKAR